MAAVVADQVDLILTHHPPPRKSVAIAAVAEQAFCALMACHHALAGRGELRLRTVSLYPLALGDAALAGRSLIEQVLAQASFDLEPRLISNSVETMKHSRCSIVASVFNFASPGRHLCHRAISIALPLVDPPLLQADFFWRRAADACCR